MTIKKRGETMERSEPARKGAATLSTTVYQELRADLLAGRLKPGEKLRAEALGQRFSIASSPIREALNRLVSEGFVLLEDQKGFRVAPVSESELRELVVARCWIDGAAVTESIREFDVAWEEALVLSLHRLSRVSRWASADTTTPDPAWNNCTASFTGHWWRDAVRAGSGAFPSSCSMLQSVTGCLRRSTFQSATNSMSIKPLSMPAWHATRPRPSNCWRRITGRPSP